MLSMLIRCNPVNPITLSINYCISKSILYGNASLNTYFFGSLKSSIRKACRLGIEFSVNTLLWSDDRD